MKNFIVFLLLIPFSNPASAQRSHTLFNQDSQWTIKTENYAITINRKNAAYGFYDKAGKEILEPHSSSGFMIYNSPIDSCIFITETSDAVKFQLYNKQGLTATLTVIPGLSYTKFSVKIDNGDMASILGQTKGKEIAYGLADHGGFNTPYSTNVTGYKSGYFGALTDSKPSRMVSNFIIDPLSGVAFINIEPGKKIIRIEKKEWGQGVFKSNEMPALYYFFGTPKQIYREFQEAKQREGYPFYIPKYEFFGVGWEAFGALGWYTNEITVRENIGFYIKNKFPLSWAVIGSGFWPNHHAKFMATTSFGLWDSAKYSNPKSLLSWIKSNGLKVILGLRISFIPNGPFTSEGTKNGYFIKENGVPRLFKVGFPHTDCYLLDEKNPKAVDWYVNLCKKWIADGADGFKEDLFGYDNFDFDDDKLNEVNKKLMDIGCYIMGRNAYLSSVSDIHRFEDFNYNQNQDRGPVNGLALAYSGFPFVYPDIIGGTGLANDRFGKKKFKNLSTYLMRSAIYAGLHPSMSFGYGIEELDSESQMKKVFLRSAYLHHSLQPYFYSSAMETVKSGFPYTFTPLPLAFYNDQEVHKKEDARNRRYQWMIGESLMACPLYGNDLDSTNQRDVYLPAGTWIDFDTGEKFTGPKLLKNFDLPVTKNPLFVGGKGTLLVQDENKDLKVRVYETGYTGDILFTTPDQKQIKIKILQPVAEKHIKAHNKTNKKVIQPVYIHHAWEFSVAGNNEYRIGE